MIPSIIIIAATVLFFVVERVLSGRELPQSPGCYARAAFLNFCQVGIVLLAGVAWNRWLQSWAVFHISRFIPAVLQGFLGWFIGTFVFYLRVCHQVHHSPARIELLTAFYKHPIEIAADSILASVLIYSLLGASTAAGAWFNVFAVLGEYFYHSNLGTPHWVGYFLQRPEHHSIHHQLDSTDSTTETLPGGTASLAPFERPMPSLRSAAFPRATSGTSERWSCFEMSTESAEWPRRGEGLCFTNPQKGGFEFV